MQNTASVLHGVVGSPVARRDTDRQSPNVSWNDGLPTLTGKLVTLRELVASDGSALLVNRGWMATENTNARPTGIPAPPRGRVTVEGWLRPDNRAGDNAVVPVDGQVRAIASSGLAQYVGRDLLPGFLNLQKPATDGLSPEPRPHVGHALNFFYALQWWFFAGLALVGPFWFSREPQAKATRSA